MTDTPRSVIHGTLRTDDLLVAFTEELEHVDPVRANELYVSYRDVYAWLNSHPDRTLDIFYDAPADVREDAAYLVNEVLIDALDNHAPTGYYFGSHVGDGSDFGYWPVELLD